MVWFKVDDGFHASRKVMSIPRAVRLPAIGLWAIAGSWSAAEELDGFVPDYMIDEWGGTPQLVDVLVKAGLWEPADEGTQFTKWAEYQPTREELEAKRESERVRKAEWRRRKADSSPRPGGTPNGRTTERRGTDVLVPSNPTRPDPTRPDHPSTPPDGVVEGDAHEGALPPFCPKHMPDGPAGKSCRACGDARMAIVARDAARKAKPTQMPPRISDHPKFCPDGAHKLAVDGTCIRCEYRPEVA